MHLVAPPEFHEPGKLEKRVSRAAVLIFGAFPPELDEGKPGAAVEGAGTVAVHGVDGEPPHEALPCFGILAAENFHADPIVRLAIGSRVRWRENKRRMA